MAHKFTLGSKVKCIVTGFTGIAVARLEYLNGCIQYGVKPKVKKEKPSEMPDAIYIDQQQLKIDGKGIEVDKKKETPGADFMPDAPNG